MDSPELKKLNANLDFNNVDRVYGIDEIDQVIYDLDPGLLLFCIETGRFSFKDNYFEVDQYGNLVSYESLDILLERKYDILQD